MNITLNPAWEWEVLENGKEHQKYYLKDKTVVPGVTTVLNVLNKPELIPWAWKLGSQGIDYKNIRDKAGNVGTIAHFICQCYVTEKNATFKGFDEDNVNKAYLSFEKFREFWDTGNFKLVASEIQLVSEEKKYGGTLDLVVLDEKDRMILLDMKTSKGIYSSHWSQLSAYRFLWDCNHKDFIEECRIIRLGKEDPLDFEVQEMKESFSKAHEDRFFNALGVYNADRKIASLNPRKRNAAI